MKKKVHYITISERYVLNIHNNKAGLRLERQACIQRANDWPSDNDCRNYYRPSEASILRLAKIQEKLVQ